MSNYDYFYRERAEQYSFYTIPKELFTAERFKCLSCEAKVLYGLMLDRMSLSRKNGWIDDEERVYIVFTVDEIAELIGCASQKAVKISAELNQSGLIEKKRLGFGKPNVIYVKDFMSYREQESDLPEQEPELIPYEEDQNIPEEVCEDKNCENHNSRMMKITNQEFRKSQFKNGENHNSGVVKITIQEFRKSQSNNTNINNTEYSDTEYNNTESIYPSIYQLESALTEDTMDEMRQSDYQKYKLQIQKNIDYDIFQFGDRSKLNRVDEIVDLIVQILMIPQKNFIRTGGLDIPAAAVQDKLMALDHEMIEYVLDSLDAASRSKRIKNIRAYLLTALYNAPSLIANHAANKAVYDLHNPDYTASG